VGSSKKVPIKRIWEIFWKSKKNDERVEKCDRFLVQNW
jgi:hypothetical protein